MKRMDAATYTLRPAMTREEYYDPEGNDGNPISWRPHERDVRPGTDKPRGVRQST